MKVAKTNVINGSHKRREKNDPPFSFIIHRHFHTLSIKQEVKAFGWTILYNNTSQQPQPQLV